MFVKKGTTSPRNIDLPKSSARNVYPVNIVKNQRFNFVTFLPIVLYEQFKFFSNMYFLLVALSQFIPALVIGYIITYFGPLCFVLACTLSKEAFDDYKRWQRDTEANSQLYEKLTIFGRATVPSSKLEVGDFIYLEKNQRVPADCLLLRTTDTSGSCFLRTDQLDGETDWKLRLALPFTQKLSCDEDLLQLQASVYCEAPHKDLYTFLGNATRSTGLSTTQTDPLDANNTLWMNTVMASPGHCVALVIYTGVDTRAVLNTTRPRQKVGKVDLEINSLAKILCLVTFVLSFAMVALNGFKGAWYIVLVRFLILFSSIIPISLRVNLDMGKTVYSYFIMKDDKIPGTIVRTSTIPEELGRIEYLFSDKTGTLTKNEMELKRLHMGTLSYTQETMDEVRQLLSSSLELKTSTTAAPAAPLSATVPNFGAGNIVVGTAPTQPVAAPLNYKRSRDISTRVRDIICALGVCHNVTPVVDEVDGSLGYQASSPDEIALVKFIESVGLSLVYRDRQLIQLKPVNSKSAIDYEILDVFPFTSETKRMGVIVREKLTNELWFYEKGADTVMAKIVMYNDWLEEECGNMAREGLRTLVIARKKLSESLFAEYSKQIQAARTAVTDRNAQVNRVVQQYLEKDLELLGLTGVEDKLQDDVKNTLESLRNAGLKIWMLTGDKIETATCIAISAKLIARNQAIHTIEKVSNPLSAQDELEVLRTKVNTALVIDGESLQTCMDHWRPEFVEIAIRLPVVVACRCSPTQKAEITNMIKVATRKRVAAIGDGGNDVSMIQMADVGVGIVGKEGRQASLAADFSVLQFRCLTRLLLWHGRNSYQGTAKLSQFVIHRGLVISVIQAVFSAIYYFSPIALYQGLLVVGYTTVYTMAPVFSLVLDTDVTDDMAVLYPELYKDLVKGRELTYKTFFWWLCISVWQGGVIMLMAIWLFDADSLNIVSITFTALIFNELLMVIFKITTWHRYMVIALLATFLIYVLSMLFLPTYFDLSFILTWNFVWKTIIITFVSAFPLWIIEWVNNILNPPSYAKLQRYS